MQIMTKATLMAKTNYENNLFCLIRIAVWILTLPLQYNSFLLLPYNDAFNMVKNIRQNNNPLNFLNSIELYTSRAYQPYYFRFTIKIKLYIWSNVYLNKFVL